MTLQDIYEQSDKHELENQLTFLNSLIQKRTNLNARITEVKFLNRGFRILQVKVEVNIEEFDFHAIQEHSFDQKEPDFLIKKIHLSTAVGLWGKHGLPS